MRNPDRRTLQGVDTGGGLPVFRGSWSKDAPKERIEPFIASEAGSGFWTVLNLRIEDYGTAVQVTSSTDVVIDDVDVTRSRDAFVLAGPNTARVAVRGCEVKHYTKRAVRIRGGVEAALIEEVHADAGGEAWAVENFPIGFHVLPGEGDAPNRDIRFVGCTGRNNWHMPEGKKYWNGDGFAAEGGNTGIVFERCEASGNTDGGWDVKAEGTQLIDCIAAANKRNFRVWGAATLINCRSASPKHYGGSGGPAGLWVAKTADVTVERSQFDGEATAVAVEYGDGKHGRVVLKGTTHQTPSSGKAFEGPQGAVTVEQ